MKIPQPGDEFTDDQGETRVVALVDQVGDEFVIFDACGDAVIVGRQRFEAFEGEDE